MEIQSRLFLRRSWQSVAAGCLGLMITLAALISAPAAAMPPRPPRPTTPPVAPRHDRTLLVLVLALEATQQATWQELWTVVQWQDASGSWHDVEGWRGLLDEQFRGRGKKTWVVEDPELGRGPFRWLVYDHSGGALLGSSAAFDLPSAAGDILEINVSQNS